jgi:hypothetical protein
MVRLPASKLAEAMRNLWPHLLSELVIAFDKLPGQQQSTQVQVMFEALKLVDLMSQLNIEDFQMN